MSELSIYSGLSAHREKGYSPFHTPGHKCAGFFPQELLSLDLTELPDTDALYEAGGIIANTEKKLSSLFGSEASLISCGGCTLAIQTMLALSVMNGNKKVIFARNSHRSAVNACALLGIEPVWIMPESSSGYFTGRVTPGSVELALDNNPDAAAVYITSPSYYGELSDISGIAEVCHRSGKLLLVDNAHGSHLAFLEENLHPIHLGADMSACSLHKTLPVLTGGAALNIADGELAVYAKQKMALFGSTSPSYPIMASIDLCCDYMAGEGREAYRRCEQRVREIKQLAGNRGLLMPEGSCDPLRVCINTACAGLEAGRQTEYFHSFLVEPEMCDGANAVFICTPFNSGTDMLRLKAAVSGLSGRYGTVFPQSMTLPARLMLPREAVLSVSEPVSTERAAGRIAAESACPCPPGVPVVMPGELIDDGSAELLALCGIESILCVRE